MGRELGRISGPLLTDNLLRKGENLAFESSLLYLDVNNRVVGFNTSTPTRSLEIQGLAVTDNLIVDTQLDVNNNYEINTNTITNFLDKITISPTPQTYPIVVPNAVVSGSFTLPSTPYGYQISSTNLTQSPSNVVYAFDYYPFFNYLAISLNIGTYGANVIDYTGINGVSGLVLTINGVSKTILGASTPNYANVVTFNSFDLSGYNIALDTTINFNIQFVTQPVFDSGIVYMDGSNPANVSNISDSGIVASYTFNTYYRNLTLILNYITRPGLTINASGVNGTTNVYLKINNESEHQFGVDTSVPNQIAFTFSIMNPLQANQQYNFTLTYLVVPAAPYTPAPSATYINSGGTATDNLKFLTNVLSATTPNTDINLSPTGATVNFNSNVLVNGNLHATGDVTWDGDIIFGNSSSDLVDFYGKVHSGIFPLTDATWGIGNSTRYFGTTYVNNYNTNNLTGKNLNPVVSINYPALPDNTRLTITGTTITLPSTGISIQSSNGSGVLNFSNDIVLNGGFETGDLTGWTGVGRGATFINVNIDDGGFDPTFSGDKYSFFRMYTGTNITYRGNLDNYNITFDTIISIFQLGTLFFTTNNNFYFIGNCTNSSCSLYNNYVDSVNNQNAIDVTTLGLTPNTQYFTDSGLTINASVYQSYGHNPQTALTTYPITLTDKVMFSVHIDANYSGVPVYVGIGTHQTNLQYELGVNGRTGGNVSSYAFKSSGQDTNGHVTPSFAQGDNVDIAVDRINGKIWIRVNGGDWNNDPAQNPTLTIGGFDISYLTILQGPTDVVVAGDIVYPGVSVSYTGGFTFGSGDSVTINTITPYSIPGNFVLAHSYPSTAHGGIYFSYLSPYLNTDGGLYQTLNTYPGMTYTVKWYLRVLAAVIKTPPSTISISFNGVTLDTITNDIDYDWHERTYTVTATGYQTVLRIDWTNSPGYFYVDDIKCVGLFPYIKDNKIQNITNGTLTLANTGRGYVQFNTTTGLQLPVGTNSNYPSVVQTGLTRYNSDKGIAEVYNGTAWQMIADVTGYATQDEIQNILNVWSIILG